MGLSTDFLLGGNELGGPAVLLAGRMVLSGFRRHHRRRPVYLVGGSFLIRLNFRPSPAKSLFAVCFLR